MDDEEKKSTYREVVIDIIETTLARYATATPINYRDALTLAATDDTVSLDGVYFLIRRQPDKFPGLLRKHGNREEGQKIRLSSPAKSHCNNLRIDSMNNSRCNDGNDNSGINGSKDSDDDDHINNSKINDDTRKRKIDGMV